MSNEPSFNIYNSTFSRSAQKTGAINNEPFSIGNSKRNPGREVRYTFVLAKSQSFRTIIVRINNPFFTSRSLLHVLSSLSSFAMNAWTSDEFLRFSNHKNWETDSDVRDDSNADIHSPKDFIWTINWNGDQRRTCGGCHLWVRQIVSHWKFFSLLCVL